MTATHSSLLLPTSPSLHATVSHLPACAERKAVPLEYGRHPGGHLLQTHHYTDRRRRPRKGRTWPWSPSFPPQTSSLSTAPCWLGKGLGPWTWERLSGDLVAQMVKNLPAMRETRIQSLGQEEPLEKDMAARSSILAWRVPWTEESMESQRVGHDWRDFTHTGSSKMIPSS